MTKEEMLEAAADATGTVAGKPDVEASGTVAGKPDGEVSGTVEGTDDDFKIPEGWEPSISADYTKVITRESPSVNVPVPSVNIGGMEARPTNVQHILSPEQLKQQKADAERQALIDRGASYAGKDLKQLMKDNPGIRPIAMRNAINAYNKANGIPEMDEYDTIAFFGGNDPYKSRQEVKKDKRRMMWAEGINGIADVLQNVVNLSTASDNSKHNAADMTNYHRQLRKNLDEQRVKRLGDLMSQIKADNDAKRAAALKQQEFQNAIALKQLEWNSPKMALELRKLEADTELANIKTQVEAEKLIQEKLTSAGLPAKMAAEIAKLKAEEIVRRNQAGYYGAKAKEARNTRDYTAQDRYYNSQADEKDMKNFLMMGGDFEDTEAFEEYKRTGKVKKIDNNSTTEKPFYELPWQSK